MITLLSCDDIDQHPDGDVALDDRHLVQALKAAGYAVQVLPWNRYTPPEIKFARASQVKTQVESVIVRTTWDYTDRCDEFLAKMRAISESGARLYNPYSIIKWNAHKGYLLDLERRGIPIVPTQLQRAGEKSLLGKFSDAGAEDKHEPEFILKPAVSATSKGLLRVKREQLDAVLASSTVQAQDYLLQPFFAEILEGEYSFHFFNRRFSHAILKRPKLGDFRVQSLYGGREQSHVATQAQLKFAEKVMAAVDGDLLVARVDFVETAQGPLLMELELIEPALYFGTALECAPQNFVEGLERLMCNSPRPRK